VVVRRDPCVTDSLCGVIWPRTLVPKLGHFCGSAAEATRPSRPPTHDFYTLLASIVDPHLLSPSGRAELSRALIIYKKIAEPHTFCPLHASTSNTGHPHRLDLLPAPQLPRELCSFRSQA